MSDILCMYYSRTGHTKKVMEEVASSLDAELVELSDEKDRSGFLGWLKCGMDAVRRTTTPLKPWKTERPLKDYRLVILGTPVWAGRCSAIMRAFLKKNGRELRSAAYLLTRGGDQKYEEIFSQMDFYVPCGHQAAASIRAEDVGAEFWREEFLREIRTILED